jgi:predicted MPP superfamily phosphohydrolase
LDIGTKRLILNGPVFNVLYGIYNYFLLTFIANLFVEDNGSFTSLILAIAIIIVALNLIAILIEFKNSNIITRTIARISEIWKGTSLYLLWFTIAIYIIGWFIAIPKSLIFLILFVIVPIIAIYSVYNAIKIRTNTVNLEFDNLHQNISFAHISDVHFGSIRNKNFLKRITKEINNISNSNNNTNTNINNNSNTNSNSSINNNNINANKTENPIDFLVITGDIADGTSPIAEDSFEPLSEIKVPVFFVIGNHDYYPGIENVLKAVDNANIKTLTNEIAEIKNIEIIGIPFKGNGPRPNELDDLDIETLESIKKSNNRLDKGSDKKLDKIAILLYHIPIFWDLFRSFGVDLVLSGHTHGGQFFPFNFGVKTIFPFFKGLYTNTNTNDNEYNGKNQYLYVSEGIGTLQPPMRLGTNAEIAIFNLKPSQKSSKTNPKNSPKIKPKTDS